MVDFRFSQRWLFWVIALFRQYSADHSLRNTAVDGGRFVSMSDRKIVRYSLNIVFVSYLQSVCCIRFVILFRKSHELYNFASSCTNTAKVLSQK
jgi:hypothetical protein